MMEALVSAIVPAFRIGTLTGCGIFRKEIVPMSDQALKDLKKDIYLMLHKSLEMIELAEDAFVKNKIVSLDQAEELAQEIEKKEDHLTDALSKISSSSTEARNILTVPSHIEKMAYNLRRLSDGIRTKIKDSLLFSDKAIQETGTLFAKAQDVMKKASDASVTANAALAAAVKNESDDIVRLAEKFATSHENRLVTGECSPKASSTYLCILYSFEDIVSHTKEAIKKLTEK
jgi:Na+/phosphate symporter